MSAWRILIVCNDGELAPFRYHEQLVTVGGGIPDLAHVLQGHAEHDIQAILVDHLGEDGEVRIRPPVDRHPVIFWRELADVVAAAWPTSRPPPSGG